VALDDEQLTDPARRLVEVPGIVAVLLGGSRARGDHLPESDVDLGLYYLQSIGFTATSTVSIKPGKTHRRGRFAFHGQAGHPFGVPDFAYAGEVALGVVLADPTGELAELHDSAAEYPPALGTALVARLWEASFLLEVARKALPQADAAYVAGRLFRIVVLRAHALHGHAGQWLINEMALSTVRAGCRTHREISPCGARAARPAGYVGRRAQCTTRRLVRPRGRNDRGLSSVTPDGRRWPRPSVGMMKAC
jgi:Nucleotidyltransferase domain